MEDSKKANKDLGLIYCNVCNMYLANANSFALHVNRERHQMNNSKTVTTNGGVKVDQFKYARIPTGSEIPGTKKASEELIYCNVCNMYLANANSFALHVNRERHQMNNSKLVPELTVTTNGGVKVDQFKYVRIPTGSEMPGTKKASEELIYCNVCDMYLANANSFASHIKSKRHQMNNSKFVPELTVTTNGGVKVDQFKYSRIPTGSEMPGNKKANEELIYCSVCDMCLANANGFASHVKSERHQLNSSKLVPDLTMKTNNCVKLEESTNAVIPSLPVSTVSNKANEHLLYCNICDIYKSNTKSFTSHINRKKHKKKLALSTVGLNNANLIEAIENESPPTIVKTSATLRDDGEKQQADVTSPEEVNTFLVKLKESAETVSETVTNEKSTASISRVNQRSHQENVVFCNKSNDTDTSSGVKVDVTKKDLRTIVESSAIHKTFDDKAFERRSILHSKLFRIREKDLPSTSRYVDNINNIVSSRIDDLKPNQIHDSTVTDVFPGIEVIESKTFCNFCNTVIPSGTIVDVKLHGNGKCQKPENSKAFPILNVDINNDVKDEESKSASLDVLYCNVCDIYKSNAKSFTSHINGKKHKKKLALSTESLNNINQGEVIENEVRPTIVKNSATLRDAGREQHVNVASTEKGNKFVVELKERSAVAKTLPDKKSTASVFCYVCNVNCPGDPNDFTFHVIGRQHQNNLALCSKVTGLKSSDEDRQSNVDQPRDTWKHSPQKSLPVSLPSTSTDNLDTVCSVQNIADRIDVLKLTDPSEDCDLQEKFPEIEIKDNNTICKICNVKIVGTAYNIKHHFESKFHNSNMIVEANNADLASGSSTVKTHYVSPSGIGSVIKPSKPVPYQEYCAGCKVTYPTGAASIADHLASKKHRKVVKAIEAMRCRVDKKKIKVAEKAPVKPTPSKISPNKENSPNCTKMPKNMTTFCSVCNENIPVGFRSFKQHVLESAHHRLELAKTETHSHIEMCSKVTTFIARPPGNGRKATVAKPLFVPSNSCKACNVFINGDNNDVEQDLGRAHMLTIQKSSYTNSFEQI